MSNKQRKSRRKVFRLWFSKRRSRADASHLSEISDNDEQDDECMDDSFVRSLDRGPCILNNELRIFVGTWNVAGRSPVGSLAVDLDEWLNLKEAADIYVLGFQEIVPLKPKTVIGAEDPTEATNWNVLIGKTLNSKYGGAWLTPMVNPITNDNYQYDQADNRLRSDYEIATSPRGQCRTEYELSDRVGSYKLMASKKMVGVFISVWMRRALLKKYCVSEVKVSSVACGIMGYLGNKGSVSVSMSIGGTSFCFVAAHLASGEKKGDEGKRNRQVTEIFRRTSFTRGSEDCHKNHPLTILGHECDRILWYGKGVKQLSYFRSESKFSDHRPVSALFSVLVEDQKCAHSSLVPFPSFSPLRNS